MKNNDILIRLRYAFDIKNDDMVKIFTLGGLNVTKEETLNMLIKVKDEEEAPANYVPCNNKMLESFLNGFITYKRGPQKSDKPAPTVSTPESPNNMLLKKVKVALSLTSEDVLALLYEGGVNVSKGELGAILRNPSHKNYRECGDKFARHFLKGLTVRYRG